MFNRSLLLTMVSLVSAQVLFASAHDKHLSRGRIFSQQSSAYAMLKLDHAQSSKYLSKGRMVFASKQAQRAPHVCDGRCFHPKAASSNTSQATKAPHVCTISCPPGCRIP